jgi:hypothetical protein
MYQLTLILPDGSMVLTTPSPINSRYIHLSPVDGTALLSDDPAPPAELPNCDTFARVASAVHVDDDRCALFVRVAA